MKQVAGSGLATGQCNTPKGGVFNPNENSPYNREVFQCTDFQSPTWPNPTGMTILAGHSSVNHSWATPFDSLGCDPTTGACGPYSQAQMCSVQTQTLPGRVVYLQTTTSGSYWFKYTITGISCPVKGSGPTLTVPNTGGLLLVTCLEQIGKDDGATNNLFITARLDGVTTNTGP